MPSSDSLLEWIARQPRSVRQATFKGLNEDEIDSLAYAWLLHARPNQLVPSGQWSTWLVLAGRGFGKTRTGGEFIRGEQKAGAGRMALVAPTAADAREVMVEGESGILAVCPPDNRPDYEPSKRRLTWPNGAIATTYSADEPDRLRGPQHEVAWCDEIAAWKYGVDAWDNLQLGLRLGANPRTCASTTPKPVKLVRDLVKDPATCITRGSSYDNRSNLPPKWFAKLIRKFEGTRLGRQELLAELLEDTPGALWSRALIERNRLQVVPGVLARVVVAIDPATTSGEESNETGICVAGISLDGQHGFILADMTCREKPEGWARAAIQAYRYWKADRIIGESNNGGEMIESTIRMIDPNVPYKDVHASRGKVTRAEPVSALDEQGRIHHVGMFELMEDQMCAFLPGMSPSPDRVDARVWAITELMIEAEMTEGVISVHSPVRISPY